MSDELLAAIIGAVIGFVGGGVISLILQKSALRESRALQKELDLLAKQGLARSLLFKTAKIKSHLINLTNFIEAGVKDAEVKKWAYWQAIRPPANLPDKIIFTSEEMSVLLSLKNDELFNAVMPIDEIFNSTLEIFATHRKSRNELAALLPAEEMEGVTGTSKLTGDVLGKVRPKMAEVDDLVINLRERLKLDISDVSKALVLMIKAFNEGLALGLRVEDKAKTV